MKHPDTPVPHKRQAKTMGERSPLAIYAVILLVIALIGLML